MKKEFNGIVFKLFFSLTKRIVCLIKPNVRLKNNYCEVQNGLCFWNTPNSENWKGAFYYTVLNGERLCNCQISKKYKFISECGI